MALIFPHIKIKLFLKLQGFSLFVGHRIMICPFQSNFYIVFHGFGQAKFPHGGLVLDSSQFSLLPQLPQKMTLNLKMVKFNSKIIILLPKSKSVTHSV